MTRAPDPPVFEIERIENVPPFDPDWLYWFNYFTGDLWRLRDHPDQRKLEQRP